MNEYAGICESCSNKGVGCGRSGMCRLLTDNTRLKDAGERAWPHMFDDIPKKFNAKRRAYEEFHGALMTSFKLETQ